MPRTHLIAVSSLLFISLIVCAPLQANGQSGGGRPSGQRGNQQGDVFSTNTRGGSGNTTKKTQTQGLNHGNGGNRTCQTTRNTPDYDPRTCTTSKPKCVLSTEPYKVFREIDDFWRNQFAARGLRYDSPTIFPVDTDTLEGRGIMYRWNSSTIYYDTETLGYWSRTYGNQVLVTSFAHEFSHHVQNMLRLKYNQVFSEQQAEELAGVFLRYLHDKGCAASATGKDDDLAQAERFIRAIGDSPSHGNAAERWFHFNNGYQNPGGVLRRLLPPVPQRRSSSTGRPN